jgi:gas vesicle protein
MTTVRRNPLQNLISTTQKTLSAASKTVQKTATQVGKNVQKTANQVGKNIQSTANQVGKNVQKTANQVSTAVSNTTKQVSKATTDAVKHVRAETQKATEESGFNKWNSKFEAKDGKVEIGATKGFGSKMDEAATLKTFKSKSFEETPEAKKFGEKAKVAGKEVLNSVGINVFDPEKSKFENDWAATSIKTKRIDPKTVDAQGYDVGYRALAAYADGSGQVRIGKSTNVEGKIEAGAVLAQGTVEGKAKLGAVDLTGKAEATAGVTASATGQLRVDLFSAKPSVKVKAGVDAFVGVKASAEGRVGNDYVGVGAKGEVMAGLALKAKADVGVENGRFKAKVELGAALGVGGSLSFSVDVNYQKGIDAVVGTGKKAVETLGNAANAVGSGISNAASGLSNAASSGWKTVSGWFN